MPKETTSTTTAHPRATAVDQQPKAGRRQQKQRSHQDAEAVRADGDHVVQFFTGGELRMNGQMAEEVGDENPQQGTDHHDAEGRRRGGGRGLVRVTPKRQHHSQAREDDVDAFFEARRALAGRG